MTAQEHYDEMIRNRVAPKLAEMLALRRAPGCVTDDTFFAGWSERESNLTPDRIAAFAKRGISTSGKKYFAQLARFPNDPEALVSTRGEISALLNRRNWGCEGQIKASINADNVEPAPRIELADDIVLSEVESILDDNPEVAPTPKEKVDLFHKIREKRKPHPKVTHVL